MFPAKNSQRTLRLAAPVSPLRREELAFPIVRQARGLSPRAISFYEAKLEPLVIYLDAEGVSSLLDISPVTS